MSRVGKVPIKLEQGVKVDIKGRTVRVEGPKGKLSRELPEGIEAKVQDGHLLVTLDKNQGGNEKHGVTRTLLYNMVRGVHTGFVKEMDIVGVGYRAAVKGTTLTLTVGFSHPIDFQLPEGVSAKVENNTHLVLTGADKVLVGMVAATIRGFRKPEPYQGKGIKYTDEKIIRKQGKAAGAK